MVIDLELVQMMEAADYLILGLDTSCKYTTNRMVTVTSLMLLPWHFLSQAVFSLSGTLMVIVTCGTPY